MGGPVCGLAGALGLPFSPVLTGAALASGLLAAAYGALCTAFSAQLPPPWGTLLRCAGVALTLFCPGTVWPVSLPSNQPWPPPGERMAALAAIFWLSKKVACATFSRFS